MTNEILLTGCTPTPLAYYLKALGILRLVAEQQADPDTAGRWEGEHFVLRTKLTREELERFFLEQYQPTPIVAPWNGGSGFFQKDNKEGIDPIRKSKSVRFSQYRKTIVSAAELVRRWKFKERPKDDEKNRFLIALRAQLANEVLPWFDAAIMLSSERTLFPPLLGTGGNDGRLDFTNNFMQRLNELFDVATGAPRRSTVGWLDHALYGKAGYGLISKAIGQFSPGSAGGPNASTGFQASALINPWDFVLMLEGALSFAAAVTRRLESGEMGALSFPFTVRASGVGSGNVSMGDEKQARAEMWMPLWDSFVSLGELKTLFAEGRTVIQRRPAKDGLEFSRAVAALGVDRGVSAFQRYAFLMRSGKAYFATPIGRIPVSRKRQPEIGLLDDLDRGGWLDRLRRFARRDETPGRIKQNVRRLEDAIFALTQGGTRNSLQQILIQLGRIERSCAVSKDAQEGVSPVPVLSESWAIDADDGSSEYRIACALAGLYAPGMPMRAHLSPVKPVFWEKAIDRWLWNTESRLVVWSSGDIVTNLIRTLETRLLEAERQGLDDKPLDGFFRADLDAVLHFLDRRTDDTRISDLVAGLACARLPRELSGQAERNTIPDAAPLVFALLKPLFVPNNTLRWLEVLPADVSLLLHRSVVRWLASGQVDRAIEEASRRLRMAGFHVSPSRQMKKFASGVAGPRLLAALTIPMETGATAYICRQLTEEAVTI